MNFDINKKYKRFIEEYLNSTFLILSSVFVVIIKIAGDCLFYFASDVYSDFAVTWKLFCSIFLLFSISLFVIKNFNETFEDPQELTVDKYFSELTKIIYIILSLIFLNIFIPDSVTNYGKLQSLLTLLYIDTLSLYAAFGGIYIMNFMFKWLWLRRHKRTKMYLCILVYSLFILIILEIPIHYFDVPAEELAGIPILSVLSIFIIISIILIIILMTKKNNWIAILPKRQKYKLILLYFVIITISIILMIASLDTNEEGKFSIAVRFTLGAETLLYMSLSLAIPHFLRLFFSTFSSLPTTDIVERTTSELSSLTYLNNVVSKTMDLDLLIRTLTELSLQTCRGIASWTESYSKDGTVSISATQFLLEKHINLLDNDNKLHDFLKNLDKPLLVQNIRDYSILYNLNWGILPLVKSLIAVPLFAGNERFGTLVILHPEEYGLEQDDLKIMEAFGDNINLALENAKLINDSIEKERYKRELILAREIEEKLLPQSLPVIENYTLAAFSIPALEVGGDYYDIVTLKTGKKCILIGDVSGKGMSAAFYMAQLKGVVMAVASEAISASDILSRINSTLYKRIERQMYITLSALVIEDNLGNISFSRAGHMPFIINQSGIINFLKPSGIGISLASSITFDKFLEEIKLKLEPGNICLLYTDGINELKNDKNIEFGYDYLKQILKRSVYNISADYLINEMKVEIENFLGNYSPQDDMTMVVLVYHSV